MNRSTDILDYLAKSEVTNSVILAPNAPPVVHDAGDLRVVLNFVLTAEDVMDTLTGLRAQCTSKAVDGSANTGVFSFGMRGIGRIRVGFLTQRGSRVVSVNRVPFAIPDLETVCENPAVAEELLQLLVQKSGGIIAVSGVDATRSSTLVYAALKQICQTHRKVICIVERNLSYLMAHRNSLVIQCEVGADVESMREGLQSVFVLAPDVVYAGDVRRQEDLLGLADAVQSGVMVILSGTGLDVPSLLAVLAPGGGQSGRHLNEMVNKLVRVTPGHEGKLCVTLDALVHGG